MKTTELEVKGQKNPAEMIRLAVESGSDLEKLEKLLALQERWEANEAKKAYNASMTAFKANPPKIMKDKRVGYESTRGGAVSYAHASLANVVDSITTELSKHGLSASWRTKQNGKVVVVCRIAHELGHFEETELSADADSSGSKNSIQAMGSTITYLQRYTLLALTGLATHDQDDDGQVSEIEPIDEKQEATIEDYITTVGADRDKFLQYMKVESLSEIRKSDYQKAINALKAKVKK